MHDLIEHFETVLVILGFFAASTWGLIRLMWGDTKKKIDKLCDRVEQLISTSVTREECQHNRDELLRVIGFSISCSSCSRNKEMGVK